MSSSSRMELVFVILFAYLRRVRSEKLQRIARTAAAHAKEGMPMLTR